MTHRELVLFIEGAVYLVDRRTSRGEQVFLDEWADRFCRHLTSGAWTPALV